MQSFLSKATHSDIVLIQELSRKIWHQHYPEIITTNQIEYMLDMMYSEDALQKQMQEKVAYYLVQSENQVLGFVAIEQKDDGLWIHKFYIDQDFSRKSIGTKVFSEIVSLINPNKIRLTVNRQNFKSINFYFKMGFRIEKVADFDIGNDYVMNDFVMVWESPNSI